MIDQETVQLRKAALEAAREIVDPVAQEFSPEAYDIISHGGGPLMTAPRSTVTPAEQVVRMYLDVAAWLMGETDR